MFSNQTRIEGNPFRSSHLLYLALEKERPAPLSVSLAEYRQSYDNLSRAIEGLRRDSIPIHRLIASTAEPAILAAQRLQKAIKDPPDIETDPRLAGYDPSAGETPEEFFQRIGWVLDELISYRGTILLVAHFSIGLMIRCATEGGEPNDFYHAPAHCPDRICAVADWG